MKNHEKNFSLVPRLQRDVPKLINWSTPTYLKDSMTAVKSSIPSSQFDVVKTQHQIQSKHMAFT